MSDEPEPAFQITPEDEQRWRDEAVWVSPGRMSGVPCIGGHRLPTEQMARYVWAGDPDECLANFEITRAQLLVACWYQALYTTRVWRKRWGAWAKQWHGEMWSSNWDAVPWPPSKERVP